MLAGGFGTAIVSGHLGPLGAVAQRGIDAVVDRYGTSQDRFNFGYGQGVAALGLGIEGVTIAAGGGTVEVATVGGGTAVAVPAMAYGATQVAVATSHLEGAMALMSKGAPGAPKPETAKPADAATAADATAQPLAGAARAEIDRRKLVDYALDPNHPVGGNKARVFESTLGYNQSNADGLLTQIRDGVTKHPAVPGRVDGHGARFTVDIPVTGPKGSATVRTGWIVTTPDAPPRLTTLFVK